MYWIAHIFSKFSHRTERSVIFIIQVNLTVTDRLLKCVQAGPLQNDEILLRAIPQLSQLCVWGHCLAGRTQSCLILNSDHMTFSHVSPGLSSGDQMGTIQNFSVAFFVALGRALSIYQHSHRLKHSVLSRRNLLHTPKKKKLYNT